MHAILATFICMLTFNLLRSSEVEIKIEPLKDHPGLIQAAAQLWWEGQEDNQQNFSQEQTKPMADYLREHAHDQHCLIALHSQEVVGIIQLVDIWTDDVKVAPNIAAHVHEWTPWIRGLVVADAYRKKGLSKQLLKAAEQKAQELGHQFVYLGAAPKLVYVYYKQGYKPFEYDTFRGSPTRLMRKSLDKSAQ